MVRHIGKVVASLFLVVLFAAAVHARDARSTRDVERLEELGRIWIHLDLFDPFLATNGVDWDQALLDAIPNVRNARTEAAYLGALNAMLARSGDPVAQVFADDGQAEPQAAVPPALRTEAGAQIADCRGLVTASASVGAAKLAAEIGAQPTVVDCRAFRGDAFALRQVIEAIGASRISTAVQRGSSLTRSYSGFPPEAGIASGGYTSGLSLIDLGTLRPAASTPATAPLVFLVDGTVAPFEIATIATLQAAGRARVVASEGSGVDVSYMRAGHLDVSISDGIYVYPNGAMGFRADASPPADKAIETAIAQLSAGPSTAMPAPAALHQRGPRQRYDGAGVPPVEQRLLALFRFWGAIKYFYPHKALLDRPWEDALREFIPVFVAADTREAYETAILRLGTRTQDAHTSVAGLTATYYGAAPSRPAILARYIEGRLAVVALYDPALADRLSPGDEIVAIDGTPVADLEQRAAPLVAASTLQAHRDNLAYRLLLGPRDSVAVLQVQGADGAVRTVSVPRVYRPRPEPPGPAWRMLEGNIGYINLEQLMWADANRALDDLLKSKSLILDLRGYPNGTAWVLGPRFARSDAPIVVARFRRPLYQGPPSYSADQSTWFNFDQTAQPATTGRYAGRIFVLIDERAISQAEHTCLFFKAAAPDVTFVGSPTNGTNGDITRVLLPGGLGVTFTGHDVRHGNGAQLQRIGILPDVPVAPTLAGLRAGRDEVLEKALELARR